MSATEIDAANECGCRTIQTRFGGFDAFARSHQIVGKKDAAGVEEFAFVFLSPTVWIVEVGAEFIDVDVETDGFGVIDVNDRAIEAFAIPEGVEFVARTVGSADDLNAFLAAAH